MQESLRTILQGNEKDKQVFEFIPCVVQILSAATPAGSDKKMWRIRFHKCFKRCLRNIFLSSRDPHYPTRYSE